MNPFRQLVKFAVGILIGRVDLMTEDAFLTTLSTILQVNAAALTEQFKLDYGNWDSLTVMATIAAIDKYFDLLVTPKQLAACSSIKELLELTRNRCG